MKGNGAAAACVYPPAALPTRLPSLGLIFLLAPGERHAFPNGPARWKTRRPRAPLPGHGARLLALRKHSSASRYCSRVVTRRLGVAGVTPRRRDLHANNNSEGLTCTVGAAAGAGVGSSPPEGGWVAFRQIKVHS